MTLVWPHLMNVLKNGPWLPLQYSFLVVCWLVLLLSGMQYYNDSRHFAKREFHCKRQAWDSLGQSPAVRLLKIQVCKSCCYSVLIKKKRWGGGDGGRLLHTIMSVYTYSTKTSLSWNMKGNSCGTKWNGCVYALWGQYVRCANVWWEHCSISWQWCGVPEEVLACNRVQCCSSQDTITCCKDTTRIQGYLLANDLKMCAGIWPGDIPIIQNEWSTTATSLIENNY